MSYSSIFDACSLSNFGDFVDAIRIWLEFADRTHSYDEQLSEKDAVEQIERIYATLPKKVINSSIMGNTGEMRVGQDGSPLNHDGTVHASVGLNNTDCSAKQGDQLLQTD